MSKSKSFEWALTCVLHHEGGFVDHASDPGGATNKGISLRFLRGAGEDIDGDGDIDVDDILALDDDNVSRLYETHFWKPAKCDKIKSQMIATKVFDMAVNMGVGQAWKLVQRACNTLGTQLVEDGKAGPATLAAVDSLTDRDFMLLTNLRREQDKFYASLIANKPSLQAFRLGWRRRAAF